MKEACKTKLSEVEERFQYVQLYLPNNLESTRKEIDYAYSDFEQGNYELCLFKASKAKANVDTILGVFGVSMEGVNNVIEQKLIIAERNLAEEIEKGIFPILGYSYFEYANSLKDSDTFSALLYSEYALELSNLDIYFRNNTAKKIDLSWKVNLPVITAVITSFILGFWFAHILIPKKKRAKRKKAR